MGRRSLWKVVGSSWRPPLSCQRSVWWRPEVVFHGQGQHQKGGKSQSKVAPSRPQGATITFRISWPLLLFCLPELTQLAFRPTPVSVSDKEFVVCVVPSSRCLHVSAWQLTETRKTLLRAEASSSGASARKGASCALRTVRAVYAPCMPFTSRACRLRAVRAVYAPCVPGTPAACSLGSP